MKTLSPRTQKWSITFRILDNKGLGWAGNMEEMVENRNVYRI
jgi:hypothetical protein